MVLVTVNVLWCGNDNKDGDSDNEDESEDGKVEGTADDKKVGGCKCYNDLLVGNTPFACVVVARKLFWLGNNEGKLVAFI